MKFGIVGCGLIGRKRAFALPAGHQVVAVADKNLAQAEALARDIGDCKAIDNWHLLCREPGIDAVVVAVTHDALANITITALESGKHVLVEKPASRDAGEFRPIVELAEKKKLLLKVGYNHRFHPSFLKAREIFDTGALGEIMFIRGRYGHGGRVGYEKEWRAQREISGGGELIDQGTHLIDLSGWFLGKFKNVLGLTPTCFWDMNVEDNCFLALETEEKQVAWLHASWSEWKNMFCFEIYGREGKLQIDGLGGSYGPEKLTYHRMLPEMGPPETLIWEYPPKDFSWNREMADFIKSIETGTQPIGTAREALAVLEVVERIYAGERK